MIEIISKRKKNNKKILSNKQKLLKKHKKLIDVFKDRKFINDMRRSFNVIHKLIESYVSAKIPLEIIMKNDLRAIDLILDKKSFTYKQKYDIIKDKLKNLTLSFKEIEWVQLRFGGWKMFFPKLHIDYYINDIGKIELSHLIEETQFNIRMLRNI